jgi:hypothetical protein
MENSTQTDLSIVELSKDINLRLDQIHSVLGFILEKCNLLPKPDELYTPPYNPQIDNLGFDAGEETGDDDLDARDASGSVLG